MRRIIVAWTLTLWSGVEAFGAVMKDRPHQGVRGHIEVLSVEEPSGGREDRFLYRASGRLPVPGVLWLRIDPSLYLAPDFDEKSQRVEFDHDLYGLSAIAAAEVAALFRFSVGLGPTLSFERSAMRIAHQSAEVTFVDWGLLLRGDVDYAFSDRFEANFSLALQSRSRAQKVDWSYGFGMGMNF